ncbi:MAG: hypothetical protein U1E22_03360, partial [Coriobacteriia bacterium]|nr:hypothetical protein [Coriobacteriia bacterium]
SGARVARNDGLSRRSGTAARRDDPGPGDLPTIVMVTAGPERYGKRGPGTEAAGLPSVSRNDDDAGTPMRGNRVARLPRRQALPNVWHQRRA